MKIIISDNDVVFEPEYDIDWFRLGQMSKNGTISVKFNNERLSPKLDKHARINKDSLVECLADGVFNKVKD